MPKCSKYKGLTWILSCHFTAIYALWGLMKGEEDYGKDEYKGYVIL